MRQWERFDALRLSGEWHVHTSFTDGTSSVDEICQEAVRMGVSLLAFTEHVRRSLDYDLTELLEEIDEARERCPIELLSGCEAKVLPDGSLDVDDDVLRRVDYPIFAFHSFPRDKCLFLDALFKVIGEGVAQTWAHPATFETKLGFTLTEDELREVLRAMADRNVAMEINSKYETPSQRWIDLAVEEGVSLVRGSDVHSVDDLRNRDERWRSMKIIVKERH